MPEPTVASEQEYLSPKIVLMIAIAVAALLRLLYLGHKSLWLDEAVSVSIARLDWQAFRDILQSREANMALYYLLLRPVATLGQSEWQVRMISAIAGIATVPVMFFLGARLFGQRVGAIAAWLFAVNACSVVYSQEARGYSLAVLLVAASTLLFVQLIRSPSWAGCAWYAVLSALAIYAHFFSVLVIAAQWLSLLAIPRHSVRMGKLLCGMALTIALSLPAAVFVLTKNVGQLSWVPKPSLLEFYHLGLFLSAEGGKVVGNILLLLFLVLLIVAGKEALTSLRNSGCSAESWSYGLAFSCLLTPILLTLMVSLRTPVFFHRFLIVCLHAFILLAAVGLSRIKAFGIVAALLLGLSVVASLQSYSRPREQWREATSFVLSQARPDDSVLFVEPWGRVPFSYYEERARQQNRIAEIQPGGVAGVHGGTIWAVLYPLPDVYPPTRAMENQLDARFPIHIVHNLRGMRIIQYKAGGR